MTPHSPQPASLYVPGGQYHNQSASSRFIVVAFLLVSLFVSVLFSSFVKASMMNKPPTKRISYLRNLVKDRHMKPLVVGKSYITDLIKVSCDEAEESFGTHTETRLCLGFIIHRRPAKFQLVKPIQTRKLALQLQGEVSSDYRALNGIFEEHGLLEKVIDMVSTENVAAILNGTGFTIADCATFKFYYYRGWLSLEGADKGYYYCSKEVLISVHVTWYFNRALVPKEYIREFNRK